MLVHSPPKSGKSRTHRRSPRIRKPRGGGIAQRSESLTAPINVPQSVAAPLPQGGFVLTIGKIPYVDTSSARLTNLQLAFQAQVERWKADTEHYSSVTRMVMHPSYMRIIGMGPAALPLILHEMKDRPDHWLVALNAITGEDPAPDHSTFDEAVLAWLKWGGEHGFLQ